MTDSIPMLPSAIRAAAPHADATAWSAVLAAPMRSSGITTPRRIAMFVGQCAVESDYFNRVAEDLFYLTSARIADVFGRAHFSTKAEAAPYIGRPEALANYVYAHRNGNGDDESGDGWRFRGRGLIQITGKALYAMFTRAEPRAADPEWLATRPGAAASACWFWNLPHPGQPTLNSMADNLEITAATRRINGGETDLAARETAVHAALRVFEEISQKQQTSAGLLADWASKEIGPESQADALMDAELAAINAPTAGQKILDGLHEALAFARGENTGVIVHDPESQADALMAAETGSNDTTHLSR